MELTVTGRHVQISERFRRLSAEKLTKIEQYSPRTQRIDVIVSHEASRGAPKGSERVEITCLARGPVIRAEAHADDKYAALDLALAKLTERLRRANDRRKLSRRRGSASLEEATSGLSVATLGGEAASDDDSDETDVDPAGELDQRLGAEGDSPVQVREKVHVSAPMTLDQALYSMELVGHDFFLFHDKDSDRPCVVYRRHAYDYGLIKLA